MQEYDARKTKYSLQKEANLIKQKYDTRNCCPKYQELTEVQHQKIEDRRTKEETDAWAILPDLGRPLDKSPWCCYVAQA